MQLVKMAKSFLFIVSFAVCVLCFVFGWMCDRNTIHWCLCFWMQGSSRGFWIRQIINGKTANSITNVPTLFLHVFKPFVIFRLPCINAWLYLQPFASPTIVNVRPFVTLFLSLFSLFQSFFIPSLDGFLLMLHIVLRIRFAFIRKYNSTNDLTFVRITFSHYLLKLCCFFLQIEKYEPFEQSWMFDVTALS